MIMAPPTPGSPCLVTISILKGYFVTQVDRNTCTLFIGTGKVRKIPQVGIFENRIGGMLWSFAIDN